MLKLQDIMTRELLTVSPELSIREAIELLVARHVSGAPVVYAGKVVGVVSTTDLLEFAAGLPGRKEFDARDELSELDDEPTTEPSDDDGAQGTYFTELWDDDVADVKERFERANFGELGALDAHRVSETMTGVPVYALPPGASVEEAADLMRRARIHRVLVMNGSTLEGVVTTTDIANAVADHKLTARTYVFGAGNRFDDRR